MSATPIIMPAPSADPVSEEPEQEKPEESALAPQEMSPCSVIANTPPFTGLADPIIEAVCDGADLREYPEGQTVYSTGQYDGADFFVVAKGRLQLSLIDSETGQILVEEFGENALVGLDLTFNGEENEMFQRLSMTASEELTLISLDAEAFRVLAGQRPSLMRNLAIHFSGELAARRFTTVAADAAPEQRVYAELMKFVKRDAINGGWRIEKMPKHRQLADLADVEENVAASAVASLIQDEIARRDYPGLMIVDIARFNDLTQ